jgi:hypothetical protein
MKRIGVISDTHGYWDEKLSNFLIDCNEIWHAGDIGNIVTAETIAAYKPLKAVYGNIDDIKVRSAYPKIQQFKCEDVDVLITHIGGYPGKYDPDILPVLKSHPPTLFICGHSHILKVIYDKKYDLLHINPGAAGNNGLHQVRTAIRFSIDGKDFKNMEILEIPRG